MRPAILILVICMSYKINSIYVSCSVYIHSVVIYSMDTLNYVLYIDIV